jgi:hypothetical protein
MTALHVTTPFMRGDLVIAVQRQLSKLDFYAGMFDGIYGPMTEEAVRHFQLSRGLSVDGIFGPMTATTLDTAVSAKDASLSVSIVGSSSSSPGLAAFAEATKYLGAKEDPPNSNETQFGLWYGVNGVPWCNIFVSYCFVHGAGFVICDGFVGPGVKAGKGCAYVPTTEKWLRACGLLLPKTQQPQQGDIVIYNLYGTGIDHIGIVSQPLDQLTFLAVEGNTSTSNDSNGGAVMLRKRRMAQVSSFGRIVDVCFVQVDCPDCARVPQGPGERVLCVRHTLK